MEVIRDVLAAKRGGIFYEISQRAVLDLGCRLFSISESTTTGAYFGAPFEDATNFAASELLLTFRIYDRSAAGGIGRAGRRRERNDIRLQASCWLTPSRAVRGSNRPSWLGRPDGRQRGPRLVCPEQPPRWDR